MTYLYLVWVVGVLSFVCILGSLAPESEFTPEPETKPIAITIKSLSYDPKKTEIHVGDSVVWKNGARTTHTATSEDGGKTFDTGDIEPGKSSVAIKFEKEGEFKYYCKVHGKSMSGTIVVTAAGND